VAKAESTVQLPRFFALAQNDGWTVPKMTNEDARNDEDGRSYGQKYEAHLPERGGLMFFGEIERVTNPRKGRGSRDRR
jgi:hypothetical protein